MVCGSFWLLFYWMDHTSDLQFLVKFPLALMTKYAAEICIQISIEQDLWVSLLHRNLKKSDQTRGYSCGA